MIGSVTMSIDVLREAARSLSEGGRVALATVVATRGSTPQKVSARLVVKDRGSVLGTLGGGGVEAEAIREARACLEFGTPALREYALSTATDEWGLACGGTMLVFLERLERSALAWLEAALRAGAGEPVAVVTLVEGDAAGARFVIGESESQSEDAEGLDASSLAARTRALGRRALARESAELATLGDIRAYAEPFGAEPALLVVGAGHVGRALAALGKFLGLRVTVIDDRAEYANQGRFPEADRVIAAPVTEAIECASVTSRAAIVVAMRNQDLDYAAVAAAVRTPARYVGLIGARRKAILIAERLAADGVAPERIRALRSPVGLDIGARTPEEIALSILGEWLMLRQGGSGAPLRLDDALLAKAIGRPSPPDASPRG
jgi:xanthine dehydrogenase accessory factor